MRYNAGMVKSITTYLGEKHCSIMHEPSSAVIDTDAPKDNNGRGESFSPTDLVGAALASCILTTMAIVAERDNIVIKGSKAEVEKEMAANPRTIGALHVKITLPKAIPEDYRRKLEHIAHTCPVHRSLHPDMRKLIEFIYE
jgi:putative redox protein